jgi:hypothetical protein
MEVRQLCSVLLLLLLLPIFHISDVTAGMKL